MTSRKNKLDFGLPKPITKLTVEQDLRMRVLEDKLKEGFHDNKDEVITLLLALQRQNFVLGNSLTNLVHRWNTIQEEALLLAVIRE